MSNANEKLTEIANQQRTALMTSNTYDGTESDEYSSTHPNALSDGDDAGKGLTNTTGSSTDILTRQTLVNSNEYNGANSYGSSHPNALSDGDEAGKGQTNTIGGTTDILTRGNNISSNQYGPSNEYPNF